MVSAVSAVSERPKGENEMIQEKLKRIWSWFWRESLEDLIFGNQAKHKQPVGISWLDVHRLFDYRWWRHLRFRMYRGNGR